MTFKSIAIAVVITCVTTASSATHMFVTDPSVNGVDLDSPAGFTSPTVNAVVGSSLDITAGFYTDFAYGTTDWTMQLQQTGGDLTLVNFTKTIQGSYDPNSPLYVTFSQVLSAAGTWSGYLQPLQSPSCPSYRYGNGVEGGGGCGGVSESLFFKLNVTAATAPVPEPGTYAMLLAGLGALGFMARGKRGESAQRLS